MNSPSPIAWSSKSACLGAVWLAALAALGCAKEQPAPERPPESALVVCAVNEPLRYFAERIGGAAVEVRFPAPANVDPAFWSPDADAIGTYQSADLILLNGASYAKWISRASLPLSKMVDTSAAFGERLMEIEEKATHRHGPGAEHAHTGTAFTTWLDFELAIAHARAVHDAMARLRPARAEAFATNLEALTGDLHDLDEQMMLIVAEIGDEPLVGSHPVYQYWARRYGFDVRSVMWEPDVVPDDRAMNAFAGLIAEHPATVMIWEGDPESQSVTRLEAAGVRSVVFDPCGNTAGDGDWLSVMRKNIASLRDVRWD